AQLRERTSPVVAQQAEPASTNLACSGAACRALPLVAQPFLAVLRRSLFALPSWSSSDHEPPLTFEAPRAQHNSALARILFTLSDVLVRLNQENTAVFRLEAFGWSDFFSTQLTPLEQQSYSPARVAEENRQLYKLFSTRGETLAELAGKL